MPTDKQILKAIIEEIYTDGVEDIPEYWHDEERNVLWGRFTDEEKSFDFEIELEKGQITY
jgi:hypothetical protein